MLQELIEEESPRPAYTPMTAAAIARPEDGYITERAPPVELLPFEPKYKLMSARERKMLHLWGESKSCSVSEPSSVLETPVHPSTRDARRQRDSTLMPATLTWACNSPMTRSIENPSTVVRRRTSDLIAATQPWATPAPPRPASPMVTDARRQANDLIPSTMPWVTPYVTPIDRESGRIFSSDHRRKKGLADDFTPRSSVFEISQERTALSTGAAEISKWRIRGVPADGNEEAFVHRLLSQKGIHVVRAKAEIDIVTNACRGVVHVVLRSVDRNILRAAVEEANLFLTESP